MESEFLESSDAFESLESLEVAAVQILRGVAASCMSWLRCKVNERVHLVGKWVSILHNASLMACARHGDIADCRTGIVSDWQVAVRFDLNT